MRAALEVADIFRRCPQYRQTHADGLSRAVNGGRNPTLNGGVSQEFGMFSSLPG
jgi:hypothetical protein